jgi:hypothetical protein
MAWLVFLGDPVGAVHLILWTGGGDRVVVVAGHCPMKLLESTTLLIPQGSRRTCPPELLISDLASGIA